MYTTRCPECKSEIPLPEPYLGKNYRCPRCRSAFDAEHVLYGGKLIPLDELPGGRPASAGAAPAKAGAPPSAPAVPATPAQVRRHARSAVLALAGVIIALVGLGLPFVHAGPQGAWAAGADASSATAVLVAIFLLAGGLAAATGGLVLRPILAVSMVEILAGMAAVGFGVRSGGLAPAVLLIAGGVLLLAASAFATFFGRRHETLS